MFLAGAACSSADKKSGLQSTNTTRSSTSFEDESTSTTGEADATTTSGGAQGTAPTRRGTTNPTTAPSAPGAPGSTATPVDKPALQKMATLSAPIALSTRPNDGAVYIAQKAGKVLRLGLTATGAQVIGTVLDISDRISTGNEQGLLGIDFSPDGSKLYASYTNVAGDTRIVEYPFANFVANKAAERVVLAVDQPYANHNGGNIAFGPDDMLYIGLGDGGSGGDPENRAQNLNVLLGKMLRINPAPNGSAAYAIPSGNPFAGQSGKRGEIWHYGLRNPWRWSFDRANGELWIGDVGQDQWEEIDHIGVGRNGVNFGWRLREGNHAYNGGSKPSGAVDPVYEMSHNDSNCSVTGGYVYRGSAIRGFAGNYVFADFCKGKLLAMKGASVNDLGLQATQLSSFGEDASGELWVLTLSGVVYRLGPA